MHERNNPSPIEDEESTLLWHSKRHAGLCSKKLRRHPRADMQTYVISAKDEQSQALFAVVCRHGKQSPGMAVNRALPLQTDLE